MTHVLLVRHGEPDYAPLDAAAWVGPGRDLAPLTARGVEQAHAVGRHLATSAAGALISSPMTRALQTAAIISHHTGLPVSGVDSTFENGYPTTPCHGGATRMSSKPPRNTTSTTASGPAHSHSPGNRRADCVPAPRLR